VGKGVGGVKGIVVDDHHRIRRVGTPTSKNARKNGVFMHPGGGGPRVNKRFDHTHRSVDREFRKDALEMVNNLDIHHKTPGGGENNKGTAPQELWPPVAKSIVQKLSNLFLDGDLRRIGMCKTCLVAET